MESHNSEIRKNFFNSSSFKLSMTLWVLLILLSIFRWFSFGTLVVFLINPLSILIFLFSVVCLFWIPIYAVRNYKNYKLKVLLPLPLCLLALYILIFDPIFNFKTQLNFSQNKIEREAVISDIRQEKLERTKSFETSYIVSLPNGKENLSDDGEVLISTKDKKLRVFFYTFRGVLDNFSGFIYTEVPNDPSPETLNCEPTQIKKKSDNWYWVSCT